jgi:hypothetical protein
MGILNIMIRKEKAAAMARYGTCFRESCFFSFFCAMAQRPIETPYNGRYVWGPK